MKKLYFSLLVLVIVLLACRLGPLSPDPKPAPEDPKSFITLAGETVEVDPPVPDALDVAQEMVDEGDLSEVEAIMALLKIYAGELDPSELFGDLEVHYQSGWGLSMKVALLYPSLPDGSDKNEIDRLMAKLAPSRERLDLYSLPEEEYTYRSSGQLAAYAPPKQDEVPCVSIFEDGFPDDPGDRPICLLYRNFSSGGHEYRVYYPIDRRTEAGFISKVDVAFSALQETHRKLSGYAELPDIDLIFTLLSYPGDWGVRASVPPMDFTAMACPISIYPSGISLSDDKLRWVVAHESFHCITGLRKGPVDHDVTAWYTEGIAAYFANVVFPEINQEHFWLPEFHSDSVTDSLVDMSYEAFIFFQYLENRFDPAYVLTLHDLMPPQGSRSRQLESLAGIDDMQTIFHEFGRAYLTNNILDTGGGTLPGPDTLIVLPENRIAIGEGREVRQEAEAFVLHRYLLEFLSGYEYQISKETDGSDGKNGWKDVEQNEFEDIPGTVKILCEEPWEYLVLLTTASAGQPSDLTLNFTSEEEDLLDCCLIGTWEQNSSETRSNIETTMAGSEGRLVSLSGKLVMTLNEAHLLTFQPVGFIGVFEDPDGDQFSVSIRGSNTARYRTPEEGRIAVSDDMPVFEVTMANSEGSVNVPLTADSMLGGPMSGSGSFGYTCTERTLTAFTEGKAPFSSSTFTRVSEMPMTPEPEDIAPPGADDSPSIDAPGAGSACGLLTASEFGVLDSSASWILSNGSSEAAEILKISLNWPGENGNWTGITLNSFEIWSGVESDNLAVIDSEWRGAVTNRTLPPGGSSQLSVDFSGDPASLSGYILVVDFENGCILSDVQR